MASTHNGRTSDLPDLKANRYFGEPHPLISISFALDKSFRLTSLILRGKLIFNPRTKTRFKESRRSGGSDAVTRYFFGVVLLTLVRSAEISSSLAQEPAFNSGKHVVRFEESTGYFHFVFPCSTPTEFLAQMPVGGPPTGSFEPAICWPIQAVKIHKGEGAVLSDPALTGMLIVSAHNIRFTPNDPKLADRYADFRPQEIAFVHQPGKNRAGFGAGDNFYAFSFMVVCSACAPGTPVPAENNTAQLEVEYGFVGDSFKQFDSVMKRIQDLAAQTRVGVTPKNQPMLKDPPEAMGLYSDLNRRFAEFCPEPTKSCVQAYARYQECKSGSSPKECGNPPACSAFCALTPEAFSGLKAGLCTSLKLDSATLTPDWSEVAKKMDTAREARGPIDPATIHVTEAPPGPPLDFMGKPIEPDTPCSVESTYASFMMTHMTASFMHSPSLSSAGGSVSMPTGTGPGENVGESKKIKIISPGIAAGNLLYKVQPVYPPIAKAARVEGTVVLRGIISTTGEISELSVVVGPPLLIPAALDAVKQWRYRPILLNGYPVEVETTINVVFTLGGPAVAAPTGPKP
jgi:TonB family protein